MIGRFTRVFDYINHWADKTPNHTALVNRDYKISYCELRLQAISFAAFLLEAGLTKGDYIAYQIPPMREFFYMYLGASIIGVTVIGINDRAPVLEVEEIVTQYHPQIVFVNSDIRVLQMKKAINIPVINLTKIPDHRLISYGQLKAVEHAEKRISGDEIVFIILSSGSTGKPKAVCISHTNIITSALAQMREFGAPKSSCMDDVYLHYFPVNHVSGAIEWGFAPLVSGSTIVICDKFDPALIRKEKRHYKTSDFIQLSDIYGDISLVRARMPNGNREKALQEIKIAINYFERIDEQSTAFLARLSWLETFAAECCIREHLLDNAEKWLEKAMKHVIDGPGVKSAHYYNVLYRIAQLLCARSQYSDALKSAIVFQSEYVRYYPISTPANIEDLVFISDLYYRINDLGEANNYIDAVLRISEKLYGKDSAKYGEYLRIKEKYGC